MRVKRLAANETHRNKETTTKITVSARAFPTPLARVAAVSALD